MATTPPKSPAVASDAAAAAAPIPAPGATPVPVDLPSSILGGELPAAPRKNLYASDIPAEDIEDSLAFTTARAGAPAKKDAKPKLGVSIATQRAPATLADDAEISKDFDFDEYMAQAGGVSKDEYTAPRRGTVKREEIGSGLEADYGAGLGAYEESGGEARSSTPMGSPSTTVRLTKSERKAMHEAGQKAKRGGGRGGGIFGDEE